MKYSKQCFVGSCKAKGGRGYYRFPPENDPLLRQWCESLQLSEAPETAARICWRHFHEFKMTATQCKPNKGMCCGRGDVSV